MHESRHLAYSFIVATNGNKPISNPLYQLTVTLGRDKQIEQVEINCLPYTGNEVAEVGGIFTDASPFQYKFDTTEVTGSVTFNRDHESIGLLIDMTWNTKQQVDVQFPVVVFC